MAANLAGAAATRQARAMVCFGHGRDTRRLGGSHRRHRPRGDRARLCDHRGRGADARPRGVPRGPRAPSGDGPDSRRAVPRPPRASAGGRRRGRPLERRARRGPAVSREEPVPPEGPGPRCAPAQGTARRARRALRGGARRGRGHGTRRRGPASLAPEREPDRNPAPAVPGPGAPVMLRRLAVALVLAGLWALAHPAAAYAWSPGTHVFLGETILANLHLLPPSVATLLQAFPYDFLNGSIAPDTFIAKKYVPPGRLSLLWDGGRG